MSRRLESLRLAPAKTESQGKRTGDRPREAAAMPAVTGHARRHDRRSPDTCRKTTSKRRGVASLPNLLTSPRYSNLSTLRSKPQRDRESEHVWSEMLSHEGVMVFVSTASSRVFGSATLCATRTDDSAIISYVHPGQGRHRPPNQVNSPMIATR